MSNYDLGNVMERLPVLQKAALAVIGVTNVDAVDYWPYQQEASPYFWNRVESMTVEEVSQEMEIHRYQISMALVVGHLTQGYRGETTRNAYNYIPAVLNYFRLYKASHLYDGKVYTAPPAWLWTEDNGARITGIPNGTRTLANSGVEVQQIAVVFTLEVPLLFEIY